MPNAQKLIVGNGEIVFDHMGFSYPNGQAALEHFDLTVRGGEKLAFVGPSGAGKTTITKLLLRFYDVTEGAILIDGQNIRTRDAGQLARCHRVRSAGADPVPSLAHGKYPLRPTRCERRGSDLAAAQAHCHEFISTFSEGYATLVGERGVKLSGGERQRVAIARAILKNAPILVLDEATSSLDSESEALIQDALQTLMKGKTVIVIAHRLSTIMKMDRIVVIENGEIAAEGTHRELLEQSGGLSGNCGAFRREDFRRNGRGAWHGHSFFRILGI